LKSSLPDPLPPELAEALTRLAPRLGLFASRVLFYAETTSTNDVATALADGGAEEGCVVIADAQTAGRGRLGRSWASPAGAGIYASVILRPDAQVAPLLTIAAGVAIADGIEAATGLPPHLKWPNDIVVEDGKGKGARKLAGILAEGGTSASFDSRSGPREHGREASGSSWVVLGFGINVLPAAYPQDVAARATSLETELGHRIDRGLVLAESLAALSARYGHLRAGRAHAVVTAWRARAGSMFGRHVEWDAGGTVHRGIARDIDEHGALLVSDESGIRRVISGEVRWT
jgi:BirA family transcriptional regulator, biotin operon repressor / biotin---[acetyl-CoA-carboxylase] ligase